MATDEGRKVDGRRKAEFESGGDEAWRRVPTGGVVWPEADPAWWLAIRRWYDAQRMSGQASLLEQSDVESLWLWAAILDDAWQRGELKGSLLATWQQMCRDMLVTEGSRRRSKVAIDRGEDEADEPEGPAPATVASLYSKLKTG